MENLERWDGKSKGYQYDVEQAEYWDMRKDANGTIWYQTWETPRQWSIWCPAEKLTAHLHHLEQIKAR